MSEVDSESINPIGNTELTANRWYHIIVKYDGKNRGIYLDGKLDAEVENTNASISVDRPLYLGKHGNPSYPNYLNG